MSPFVSSSPRDSSAAFSVPIFAHNAQISIWPVWSSACESLNDKGGPVPDEHIPAPGDDNGGRALQMFQWLIGERPNRGLKLEEVLQDFSTNAVALLLRADYSGHVIRALKHVCEHKCSDRNFTESQELFVALAHKYPDVIASMFPDVVEPETLALCGQVGLEVALHELRSHDWDRRQQAAFALEYLADGGIDVPREPLQEFLRRESDPDARSPVEGALEALDKPKAKRPAPGRRKGARPAAKNPPRRGSGTRRSKR